ncbi:phytanoyl-CoA dioxygenase family protein [Streptomyces sp. TE33382]
MSLEEYEALAHAPALMEAAEALLEDDRILPRPAKPARLIFPQKAEVGATPPHQDFPHEQGAQEAFTAWVPLGDVPRELGGVAVWPGSHRQGVLEHGFVPGVGGLGVPEGNAPAPTWLAADFRMGDVLMFHSLTVHGALPNRSGDRLRISADFCYQRAVDPATPHMLKPSGGELDWEQIYADWQSEEFQYCWRKWGLRTVPYDRSYYRKRDEEALTRAAAGDEHARDFLTTIEARKPDPAARLRGRQVRSGARPEAGR